MSFSSNAVIAKSRAVFGRSLKAEDYVQLSSKASVAEAAAYLKQTERYGRILAGINPQTIYRLQLEELISKLIFEIFESFRKFDYSNGRAFFLYIIMQLEAEQILAAMESFAYGSSEHYISTLPSFLIKHAEADLLALGRARSFLDIADILENTKFGRLLRPLLIEAEETGKINIDECERRMYTSYYLSIMKTVDEVYRGGKGMELKRILLKSIDMENVVTCCRMRVFGASSESVKGKLLPFRYRLSAEAAERILQLGDISKIEAELDRLGYHINQPAEFDTMEHLTEQISMDFFRRTIRLSGNSAAVYYALIKCLKIETRNLKTVIEGIHYGISSSEILGMLVI